ncbi:MAG: competence/damage-inducible protein A [Candidatus Omnitrophica bacterium]|nr:competence/damage-inducible protein A [Candidatus Omnitrophota bacterium]
MRTEILTIGSELTSGATVNTNAAYLARRLAEAGFPCARQVAVPDEREPLVEALRQALPRCELLVTTGGLGPTFDDITMAAVAEAVQRPLVYVPSAAAAIRRFYTRRHRRLQRAALRQAYLPRGAVPLPNPLGTAPGIWLPLDGMVLVALPGVPRELHAILDRHVLPRLRRLAPSRILEGRTLRTVGIVELAIEAALRRIRIPPSVSVGLYPHLRAVDVRLTATGRSRGEARGALATVEAALRKALGAAVYGTDEETLEGVLGAQLVRRRKTLAVAESCTGGLLAARITDAPGSSRYFLGAVVAYHNDVKRRSLGVPAATLARHGAVSAQVAKQMAQGVRRLAGSDMGMAVTGVAGPSGGTRRKPVGLVYVGLADGRRTLSRRYQFFGDRSAVRAQAVQLALDWLRRCLAAGPAAAHPHRLSSASGLRAGGGGPPLRLPVPCPARQTGVTRGHSVARPPGRCSAGRRVPARSERARATSRARALAAARRFPAGGA